MLNRENSQEVQGKIRTVCGFGHCKLLRWNRPILTPTPNRAKTSSFADRFLKVRGVQQAAGCATAADFGVRDRPGVRSCSYAFIGVRAGDGGGLSNVIHGS
jgi:hypothetical protein